MWLGIDPSDAAKLSTDQNSFSDIEAKILEKVPMPVYARTKGTHGQLVIISDHRVYAGNKIAYCNRLFSQLYGEQHL